MGAKGGSDLPFGESCLRVGKGNAKQIPIDYNFINTRLIANTVVIPEDPVVDADIQHLRLQGRTGIISVKPCYVNMVDREAGVALAHAGP